MSIAEILFGKVGGPKVNEYAEMARRESFSKYLPYVAYSEETRTYYNADDTTGYLWECVPLTFVSDKDCNVLQALTRIAFPQGAVLSFTLYPDPNIKDFVDRYKDGKTRDGELIQRNIKEYSKFLLKGRDGVKQLHGIPLRNFRLFVALKSKEEIPKDDIAIIEETLDGVGLQPVRIPPPHLLTLLREIFNKHLPENLGVYDETVPIRKQVIYAETDIDATIPNAIKIGDRYARCLTPKSMPKETDSFDTNGLTGGFMGVTDDTEQINTPFLWTVNIVFDDVKTEIHNKANMTMMQKASGSFAQAIARRADEFAWALDELESSKFFRVIPVLWIFGDDEDKVRTATARARRIWESKNYVMQEETAIKKPMFFAALPFGLYASKNNIRTLDRDFFLSAKAMVRVLPIQADFVGSQDNPVLAYIGRKGQVIGLDVFDHRSNNHNFLVTAGSGAGKSFNLNSLLSNYYAANSKIRVVDLGYSYQKLARLVGGRFMDFGDGKVTINPFDSHAKEEEDKKFDLIATTNIVAEMVYSASGGELSETEWTLLKEAVRFAAARDGGEYGIDGTCDYLSDIRKHGDDEIRRLERAVEIGKEMAFNLKDFRKEGIYGNFFNGKSSFDIRSDDFVVLELERLKPQAELFRVITMQVLNAVTQDLYWSDRSNRRFILFEEAWSFFDSGDRIGKMIQEGYRRARKYHGSFGIVTQSYLDLLKFGDAGDVIRANAAYKFLMESEDYVEAAKQNLLEYEGLALKLVNSIKNNKPRYSEMFLETPFGRGPARLLVDRWNYFVATSAGPEVKQFHELMDQTNDDVVQTLEIMSGIRAKPGNLDAA